MYVRSHFALYRTIQQHTKINLKFWNRAQTAILLTLLWASERTNKWTYKIERKNEWMKSGQQETGTHVTCIHIKMKLYTVFVERNILKINCLRRVNVCKIHVCMWVWVWMRASVLLLLCRSIWLLFISEAEENNSEQRLRQQQLKPATENTRARTTHRKMKRQHIRNNERKTRLEKYWMKIYETQTCMCECDQTDEQTERTQHRK